MVVSVFIQNEAGSNVKNYHDEKTLEWKRSAEVSLPYPYPYGFVLGTTAADGCNVDCFVITRQPLQTGQIVECTPIGLMEQVEDGAEDHNVLASLPGEQVEIDEQVRTVLTEFVHGVFAHVAGKHIDVGRFLGHEYAGAHLARCRDGEPA